MAINPKDYTISYTQLLRNTSVRERMDMAKSDSSFYNQLAQTLTPSQMASLFPRYYREKLPDIGGFDIATSQIAAGKFGQGISSPVINRGEASGSVVGGRPYSSKKTVGAGSDYTGKVNEEKLRAELPKDASEAFDAISKGKKKVFNTKDDPFSNLTDAELKKAGLKRSKIDAGKEGGVVGNVYTQDTMTPEVAKKYILDKFKTGKTTEVTGFKFNNPIVKYSAGDYYKKNGAGMGNKEDNSRIQTELANYIAKKGKEAGYTDAAIKGLVANGFAESHMGLLPYGDNGASGGVFHLNKHGAGSGTDVTKFHVNSSNSTTDEYIARLKESVDYTFNLLQNDKNYSRVNETLKTTNDVGTATDVFLEDFENPAVKNYTARRELAAMPEIANATFQEVKKDNTVPRLVQDIMDGTIAQEDIPKYAADLQTDEERLKLKTELAKAVTKNGGTPQDARATAELVQAKGTNNAVHEDQSGIRSKPIKQKVSTALEYAADQNNVEVEVFSGGQMSLEEALRLGARRSGKKWILPNGQVVRTGTVRHDEGGAADVKLFRRNAKGEKVYLSANNPDDRKVMSKFVSDAVSGGATGVGAGNGYMGPEGIHIGLGRSNSWGGADWIESARQKGANSPIDIEAWKKDREQKRIEAEKDSTKEAPATKITVTAEDLHVEDGQKHEDVSVTPTNTVEGADYTVKSKKQLETRLKYLNTLQDNQDAADEIKAIQDELKYREADLRLAGKSTEELTAELQGIKGDTPEELARKAEIETTLGRRENGASQDAALADIPDAPDKRKKAEPQAQPTAEPLVTATTGDDQNAVKLAEGGTIKAKDDLKVVRKDGSPTGIEVASDETAVIIPPAERRQAKDVVSLDGTDQRASDVAMDDEALNSNPAQGPKNVAAMTTGAYNSSNQSTVPSSLGSIDYAPSALRAYERNRYDGHFAPRTIYTQK